jgi:hypothetical protein
LWSPRATEELRKANGVGTTDVCSTQWSYISDFESDEMQAMPMKVGVKMTIHTSLSILGYQEEVYITKSLPLYLNKGLLFFCSRDLVSISGVRLGKPSKDFA